MVNKDGSAKAISAGPKLSSLVGPIAGLAILSIFGPVVNNAIHDWRVSQNYIQSHALTTLEQYYPDEYKQLIVIAREADTNLSAANSDSASLLLKFVKSHVGQMSDSNADKLFSMSLKEVKLVRDRDPIACWNVFAGSSSGTGVATVNTPEMSRDLDDTLAGTIQQIATEPAQPAPPLSATTKQALAASALNRLAPGERQLIPASQLNPNQATTAAQARAMCDFGINFLGAALEAPEGTARSIMAGG